MTQREAKASSTVRTAADSVLFKSRQAELEGLRNRRNSSIKTAVEQCMPLISSGKYHHAAGLAHRITGGWTREVTLPAVQGALAELRIMPGRITAVSGIAIRELDGEIRFVGYRGLEAATDAQLEALRTLRDYGQFIGVLFPQIRENAGKKIQAAAQLRLEQLEGKR